MNRVLLCAVLLWGTTTWSQAPTASSAAKPKPPSPFADYAGVWTGNFDGHPWLRVQLTLVGEKLNGWH